jgi:hypothetical protein
MFVKRKVRYSALFTNLVGQHTGAVSLPLCDVILAQLAFTLSDIMICLHSGIINLSLYKHWLVCRNVEREVEGGRGGEGERQIERSELETEKARNGGGGDWETEYEKEGERRRQRQSEKTIGRNEVGET